jgi:4-hydroxybenzoate polyprenyltransferase
VSWHTALRLGRISNLPTVWTNVLAGLVLAGGQATHIRTLPLLAAMSLFYVGGMYLNDAFDADIDARERPERPIPSGLVSRGSVYAAGFAMLAVGELLLLWIGILLPDGTGPWPGVGGAGLAAAIVLYNRNHKDNPLSPLVMGVCRMLVYVIAGMCVASLPGPALVTGAVLVLAYLIGLTYAAKQENIGRVANMWPLAFLAAPLAYGLLTVGGAPLSGIALLALAAWTGWCVFLFARHGPGDIPRGVVGLIAGISLVDAWLIASTGAPAIAAIACVGGFVLTLILQRFVPGT